MKIRTKKEFNLSELIQHIMDNEELRDMYYAPTPNRGIVNMSKSGEFFIKDVCADDTFTVEIDNELTIFTHLEDMVEVLFDDTVIDYRYTSISDIQGNQTSEIYVAQNGKLHLIWSAESGIPESGVLEVGAE